MGNMPVVGWSKDTQKIVLEAYKQPTGRLQML